MRKRKVGPRWGKNKATRGLRGASEEGPRPGGRGGQRGLPSGPPRSRKGKPSAGPAPAEGERLFFAQRELSRLTWLLLLPLGASARAAFVWPEPAWREGKARARGRPHGPEGFPGRGSPPQGPTPASHADGAAPLAPACLPARPGRAGNAGKRCGGAPRRLARPPSRLYLRCGVLAGTGGGGDSSFSGRRRRSGASRLTHGAGVAGEGGRAGERGSSRACLLLLLRGAQCRAPAGAASLLRAAAAAAACDAPAAARVGGSGFSAPSRGMGRRRRRGRRRCRSRA